MKRNATAAILLASIALMPGCIAYEIRDELSATNEQLKELKALRGTINDLQTKALAQLDQANLLLVQTNSRLETVTNQLERVDGLLVRTDERLATLERIDTSLVSLDQQLLAVKGLVEGLSGVMSLFGSSKTEETAPDGGAPAGVEGTEPLDEAGTEGTPDEEERKADEPAERRQGDLPNQPAPKN